MSEYEFQRSVAVVIGINHYSNGIQPLKTAKADAEELARILEHDHHYHQVILVTDDTEIKPTRKNLLTLLETTLNQQNLTESDRLLFYFAGHGVAINGDDGPAGYLVPQDADLKSNDTLIPMRTVYKQLTSLKCRHLLVILDCCFAGTFRWSSTRKFIYSPKKITKAHYDRFIKSPAWQAITSSAHNQEAFDFIRDNRGKVKNTNHSPFAQALFDALHGKADIMPPASQDKPSGDGVITATELYLYLRECVELNSKELQTPGLWPLPNHDRGEYIFLTPKRELNLAETPELNQNNNPYRGLKPFEEENAPFFFGREELVKELAQRLSSPEHRLTVVLGASGSGKSSLVQAGLIPYLRQEENHWQIIASMRPGEYPFVALAQVIEEFVPNTSQNLLQNPKTLTDIITTWSQQHPQTQLLLVIDQLEELITLTRQIETQNQSDNSKVWQSFFNVLVTTLETCPQFHLIVTLRSDFETRFLDSALSSYWAKARFIVRPMRSDELREAIERPASEMALTFEPPNLVDRLIDEVGQMPGALPLLSFTLSELYIKLYRAWQEEGKEDRTLTIDAEFERQGGVAGSLTSRANQEYANLGDEKLQTTMRRVMLRMLTFEGGEVARRQVPDSELVYLDEAENKRVDQVINRLLENRLVVRGQGIEEEYTEPAHDYLVRVWDKFQDWINEDRENLALQRRVTLIANDWARSGKPRGLLLLDGDQLARLNFLRFDKNSWLNQRECEFVEASLLFALQRQAKEEIPLDAARISNLVTSQPQQALIGAINIMSRNLTQLPQNILTPAIACLFRTMETSRIPLTCKGHKGSVRAIALSPNDDLIVSGSGQDDFGNPENILCLWNLEGQMMGEPFGKHGDTIESVVFISDQQNELKIASSSSEGSLIFWSVQGKKLVQIKLNKNSFIKALAFSSKHQMLVGGSFDGKVYCWDSSGNQVKDPLEGHSAGIWSVGLSADEQTFATGSFDGTVCLWNLSSLDLIEVLPTQDSYIRSVAFSPNDRYLVSGDSNGRLHIWDLRDFSKIISFKAHKNEAWSVVFGRNDEEIISGGGDHAIRIWDLQGRQVGMELRGHEANINSISLTADGQTITSAGKNILCLWDIQDSSIGFPIQVYNNWPSYALAWHPNGQTFVSGGEDGTLHLLNFKGEEVWKIDQGDETSVRTVSFSPDGELLVTGKFDGTLNWWHSNNGHLARTPVLGHDKSVIQSLAFSPNGQIVVSSGSDRTIKLWTRKGSPLSPVFKGHEAPISKVIFSPDGNTIASCSNGVINNGKHDSSIRLWNLEGRLRTNPFIGHESGICSIAFSPNGEKIVSGSTDSTVRLWSFSGEQIWLQNLGYDNFVTSVDFSSDGSVLFSGTLDGNIHLWDIQGNSIGILKANDTKHVSSLAVNTKNQTLVSSYSDGTIRFWRSHWTKWLEVCCDRLRHHPIFKNPETEEQKQACQTCHDYVWHPEIGAEKLFQKGKKRFEEGSYEEALSIFNLVIQFNPDHADTAYYQEQCHDQLKKATTSYEE